MQWYRILARILLMLSVIDFALAAPVLVQEHEVRVSVVDAAKDGIATSPLRWNPSDKWLANAADRTIAPPVPIPRSLDSVNWQEQEPRRYNPRPRTDSQGSPEPSSPASPIDPIDLYINTPPSPPLSPGSISPLPSSQAHTDEPDPLKPSLPHGNTGLNPSPFQDQRLTDNSDR